MFQIRNKIQNLIYISLFICRYNWAGNCWRKRTVKKLQKPFYNSPSQLCCDCIDCSFVSCFLFSLQEKKYTLDKSVWRYSNFIITLRTASWSWKYWVKSLIFPDSFNIFLYEKCKNVKKIKIIYNFLLHLCNHSKFTSLENLKITLNNRLHFSVREEDVDVLK